MTLRGVVFDSKKRTTAFLSLLLIASFTRNEYSGVLKSCVYGWISYDLATKHHVRYLRLIKNEKKTQTLRMVRNIDLPEAVIFFGTQTIIPSFVTNESDEDAMRRFRLAAWDDDDDDDTSVIQARSGLARFLQECHEIETAVIVLLDGEDDDDDSIGINEQHAKSTNSHVLDAIFTNRVSRPCHVFKQTVLPPDPTDLLAILNLITIQPRPYGGGGTSIGYQRAADPERLIAPQHCVVFTTTVAQTRIARALGMRVISMNTDDRLADAVLTDPDDDDDRKNVSINLSVDDIATPGSYWLNPPHPRDDDGNQVLDPYDILKTTASSSFRGQNSIHDSISYANVEPDDDDDYLRAILADIAPLKGS